MKSLIEKVEMELSTPETLLFGKFKNIIFGASISLIWTILVLTLYQQLSQFSGMAIGGNVDHSLGYFIKLCILAPFIEELLYRAAPLQVAKLVNIKGYTLLIILLSSAIFGMAHWGGLWTVPVQGVGGLILCWVYLKNGYSYLSSVATHFLINFYVFLN